MRITEKKVAALAGGIHQNKLADSAVLYSTDSSSQRNRILERLQHGPLTTLQARKDLDVMHPAMRIKELRESGHNIVTHWETVHTGKARHRVASYVLLVDKDVR